MTKDDIGSKLAAVLAQVHAYQEREGAGGWDVNPESAQGGKIIGIAAFPKVGDGRQISRALLAAIDTAFSNQGLDKGAYFKLRNVGPAAGASR